MRFAVAVVVVAVLAWVVVGGAAAADTQPSVSSNWSGYAIADADTIAGGVAATPFTFSDATATWKQPKARCVDGKATYAAFWVGLGGYSENSSGLEQAGTDSDCSSSGVATYFAWYELVPAPASRVALKVKAGDVVTASIVVNGSSVLLQLKNRTRRTSVTKHLFMDAPDVSTAEWITEAPAECVTQDRCRVLPLANFGTVAFTDIAATGSGHSGTLTDQAWTSTAISLVPDTSADEGGQMIVGSAASTAGAKPSAPSADGRSFSVGYIANATTGG